MSVARQLNALGLQLPAPMQVPAGVRLPFAFVHQVQDRLLISGHGPTDQAGKLCGPFGKVGRELTLEQAQHAARLTTLAILADLNALLLDLDNIQWVRVFGMVNAAPGFNQMPEVINGCSDLLLQLYGPVLGRHARSAIGVAELPWNIPVEIEAEAVLQRPTFRGVSGGGP